MDALGKKVRARRKSLGLSLDELSARVGCSSSYLSLVENGKANPSCTRIVQIAGALEISPRDLFPSIGTTNQNLVLTKENRIPMHFSNSKIKLELLISPEIKKGIDARIALISPGGNSNGQYQHPGEEFGLVLKGAFQLTIDGETYNLKEGDSFYFHSTKNHSYENNSTDEAVVLWVNHPPYLM